MNLLNKLMIGSMLIYASIIGSGDMDVLTYKQAHAATEEYTPSSSVVYVDGIKVNYPVNPVIKEGTNLVPVRETFEAMGATVEWDEEERAVHATRDHTHIKLVIDSHIAYINGQEHALLKPPVIFKGKTMIPLRFVGEAFGGDVDYNPENKVITITMPRLSSDFFEKEQANIGNIHSIENVEMVGERRLMVSDNPETLNPDTITETNATLWNDIVSENSTTKDHRVFGWHINQFDKDVTIGVTIENISPTNTIEVRDLKGIHKISHNSWVDYDIGLPISEAVLNNQLRHINPDNIQVGYGETMPLGEFTLQPNETIGFLNDLTIIRESGIGELNYIVRTVVSTDGGDLTTIKSKPVPVMRDKAHPRGVWPSSEIVATLPTYHVNEENEVSYNISNGQTDNLLHAENSLVDNAPSLSNPGHYGVVYKVKIPYIDESNGEKKIRVRIASRGGNYSGTVKTEDGVFNIPTLEPMKDVAHVMDHQPIDHKGIIEFDIMHTGGSYLPISINVTTLE